MDTLSETNEPRDPEIRAALQAYVGCLERGDAVDREQFLEQYAHIADKLRPFVEEAEKASELAEVNRDKDEFNRQGTATPTHTFAFIGQQELAQKLIGEQRRAIGASTGLAGQFGRYRVIRLLGKGGMGAVYMAEDTQLGRCVALKTPTFKEGNKDKLVERFYGEARAAATLRHPNICPIYDFGQISGRHYISMAYIEGRSLEAYVQPDKAHPERRILIVVRKLALALQEAHNQGIIHRDVKSANVMVDARGEPILMDFGLARLIDREDTRITQKGMIVGSPAYMSPEQVDADADRIGPPTDQYSLGVILYELLTGQTPFRGPLITVIRQIVSIQPTPPSQFRPDLDPRIEAACLKMLAKLPQDRFSSMKIVADELAAIVRRPANRSRMTDPPADPSSNAQNATTLTSVSSPTVSTEIDLNSLIQLARKSIDCHDFEQAVRILEQIPGVRQTGGEPAILPSSRDPIGDDRSRIIEARKCLGRFDYDQAASVLEQIPQARRSQDAQTLLTKARELSDDVEFVAIEIEEALQLGDTLTARAKAQKLAELKPGDPRLRQLQKRLPKDALSTDGGLGIGWLITIWTLAAVFVAGIVMILFNHPLEGVFLVGAASLSGVGAYAYRIETRHKRKPTSAR